MATDRELVERGRDGDDRAFQELVERYKQRVYVLVQRAAADRSGVEDLAQEVFLRVYTGLPYFRGEARVSTWIYRIVVDVCTRTVARRGGTAAATGEKGEQAGGGPKPLQVGAGRPPQPGGRRASDLEWRERLDEAIARLPVTDRLLLAAHGTEGIEHEDLAEALQLPPGTVQAHAHRARRQLRRLLNAGLGG